MKAWIAFVLTLVGWASILDARVILPQSRHLAGPLNTLSSEVGEEFVNFPAILAPLPPAAGAQLSGWIEITFDEPDGDLVDFTVDFLAQPSDGAAIFGAGQLYLLLFGEVKPLAKSGGTLDLETGEIVDFRLDADVRFSGVSAFGRNNRIPPRLVHSYGRDDFSVSMGELPPGFLQNDVFFEFDVEGRITRFDFAGRTMFPIGPWAEANQQLEYFPPFAFREGGTAVFPNPDLCLEPSVPAELCPTDEANPDGLAFPSDAYFHSHLVLQSNEMREIPAERRVAPCAPTGRAKGIVEAAGGKLYHISGLGAAGLSGQVDVYDPSTGTWSETTPIPTPIYDAQSTVIGHQIYVIGGRDSIDGPAIAEVQIYDIRSEAWSNGASSPIAVAKGSAEAYGGAIYVFFGMTNDASGGELMFNESVLLYGPDTETWMPVPVPFQLEGFTTIISGGDIYLINGRTFFEGEEIVSPFVFIFSTIFNNVFFTSPTRVGIYEGTAELVGDRLFLVGGRQEFGGAPSSLTQMLELGRSVPVFDVFARSFWSPVKDIPFASTASGSAVLNGELFVVGGEASGVPVPMNVVEQFDLGRGWQACESQPLLHAGGVLSSGSLSVGAPFLAPGGLSILEGLNFSTETLDARDQASVPTSLGGISVLVDGQPAPILAVSPTRVDFQAPYGIGAFGAPIAVQVIKEDSPQQAPPVFATAFPVNPAFFVQSCGEIRDVFFLFTGSALACNADGTLNTFRNAARPGEELTLQMTGLGAIDASLANGERAPEGVSAIFMPTITVTAEDGTKIPAQVQSISLAPGEVGIYDVRIILPANVQESSRVVVEAALGGVPSNTVTIAVGEPVDPAPLACLRDTDLEFRACLPEFSPLIE